MKELEPGWYQLSRKHPWLRRAAAAGFPVRVLKCLRCSVEEKHSLKDGIAKAAKAERKFVADHRLCEERRK